MGILGKKNTCISRHFFCLNKQAIIIRHLSEEQLAYQHAQY